jgi:hypothetical protein
MIKKRLFALAMATVMVLSSSVMAFAADANVIKDDKDNVIGTDNGDGTKTMNVSSTLTTAVEATGEMQPASIKVTVPTTTQFVINPYKISAEIPGNANNKSTLQVISPDYEVVNAGEVALQVDTTVVGKATGKLTLAGGTVAATSTKKEAFLFINFKRALPTGAATAITADTEFDKDGIVTESNHTHAADETHYAVDKSQIQLKSGSTDGTYELTDAAKTALSGLVNYTVTSKSVTDKTQTPNVTYTLETYKLLGAGDYDKNATQGAVTTKETTYKNVGTIATEAQADTDTTLSNKLTFTISGSAAVNPANDPWAESDGATVTIKFNFTPVIIETETN